MNRRQFNLGLLALSATVFQRSSLAAERGWQVEREFRHASDINVEQVECSPESQVLASWATDGSFSMWNYKTNQLLFSRGDRTRLLGLRSKSLFFIDRDEAVKMNLADQAITPVRCPIDPVAISPDTEWWLGLRARSTPTLWNAKTGALKNLTAPPAVYRVEPRLSHFSEDGRWFCMAETVRAVLWHIDKPDDPIVIEDQPAEVTNIRLSRNADFIVLSALGGSLTMNHRTQARRFSQKARYGGDLRGLWLDNSSHSLLVGASEGQPRLAVQRLPSLKKPSPLPAEPEPLGQGDEVWSCWMKGSLAVTGHRGGLVKLWRKR